MDMDFKSEMGWDWEILEYSTRNINIGQSFFFFFNEWTVEWKMFGFHTKKVKMFAMNNMGIIKNFPEFNNNPQYIFGKIYYGPGLYSNLCIMWPILSHIILIIVDYISNYRNKNNDECDVAYLIQVIKTFSCGFRIELWCRSKGVNELSHSRVAWLMLDSNLMFTELELSLKWLANSQVRASLIHIWWFAEPTRPVYINTNVIYSV